MTAPTEYTYDVFISYSQADREWVTKELLPRLKEAGLRIYDPAHDPELGSLRIVSVDQAIEQSRKILLVLTPEWLADEWAQLQGLLAQFHDLSGYARRIVPVLLKPCKLPPRLAMLNYADLTNNTDSKSKWERLLKTAGTRARIWIEFDRQNESDTRLAQKISTHLRLAGHDAAIDMNIRIGYDYMLALQEQINSNDFIIILLSGTAISNEIFRQSIDHAYWRNKSHTKPVLLPVRFKYVQTLPHPLSIYLGSLQYAEWRPRSKQGLQKLVNQLLDAIVYGKTLPTLPAYNAIPEISITPEVLPSHIPSTKIATQTDRIESNIISEVSPLPSADPRFIASLPVPGGALNLLDVLYITRRADKTLQNELQRPRGTTTTIRGSRQSGKSSLLIRGIDQAQREGSEAVFIDLQPIDDYYLRDADVFFRYFATAIITNLSMDIQKLDYYWSSSIPATDKVTNLIRDYVLLNINSKLILAIDEADRVWKSPVSDGFFGMLRSWVNLRAYKAEDWYKLSLLLSISTVPSLLIDNIKPSPFNVGVHIELEDFNQQQLRDLNMRYRSPLQTSEIDDFMALLGGHPYLSSKALYLIVTESRSWADIRSVAASDHSPFSDHLRQYWWMLRDKPSLVEALKSVLKHGRCSYEAFHRLSSAGLLIGDNGTPCSFRCKLYEDYFRKSLQ